MCDNRLLVKLSEQPQDVSRITAKQLSVEQEKGYADMRERRASSAEEVFADIRSNGYPSVIVPQ